MRVTLVDEAETSGQTRATLLLGLLTLAVYGYHVSVYYFLADDAFIAFRYADHLARGLGLVWNPGERVEGYTCFLWVVMLAGGIRLQIPPELLANVLGIASGLGVLWVLYRGFTAMNPQRKLLVFVPLGALVLNRSFAAWSTGGLETMLFVYLTFHGIVLLLGELAAKNSPFPVSSVLLALATLTRPEGILFAATAGAFLLLGAVGDRRRLVHLAKWLSLYSLPVGLHAAWRLYYYGEWLPNTFYAKVPGVWIDQGFKYLWSFHSDYHVFWFLPLALIPLLSVRSVHARVFVSLILGYGSYLLLIGGDRFEFRFVVPILPYLYWLIAEGLADLKADVDRSARSKPAGAALAGLLATLLLTTTLIGSNHPKAGKAEHGMVDVHDMGKYARRRSEEGRFLRRLAEAGLLPEDLVICVGGAGAVPYYSRLTTIDGFGLNDHFVARIPLEKRGVVAHERMAPMEYLVTREVVVLDLLNQIVHEDVKPKLLGLTVDYLGTPVSFKTVKMMGRYLIFGVVDEEKYREVFAVYEVG